MSVTSGFFNSLNGDRKYNTLQVSELFDGLITDGVVATIGDHFNVSATSSSNTVAVGTGRAWFKHHWVKNDNILNVVFDRSDVIYRRYDAVVIEINDELSVRTCTIKTLKGVASANPVYPTLTKTNTVNQYPIAYILRKVNDDLISTADITQIVGKDACPFCTGILKSVSVDYLFDQWSSQWDQWFDSEKDKLEAQTDLAVSLSKEALDGTLAGSLQNQVNDLDNGKVSKTGDTMTGELAIEADDNCGVLSTNDRGVHIILRNSVEGGQWNCLSLKKNTTVLQQPLSIDSGGTGASTVSDARSNLSVLGGANKNSYWGLTQPDGTDENYIRTTKNGIIPYQSGGSGSVGSSGWPFNNGHITYFNTSKIIFPSNSIVISDGTKNYKSNGVFGYVINNSATVNNIAAGGSGEVTVTVSLVDPGALLDFTIFPRGYYFCVGTYTVVRSGNYLAVTANLKNPFSFTVNATFYFSVLLRYPGIVYRG